MGNKNEKDMLKEEELSQVAGGGWMESGVDKDYAKEYEEHHIKVLTTSVLGENTYSYGGKTYESQTELFEQLSKDGLMQETSYYVGNVLERSTFRWI